MPELLTIRPAQMKTLQHSLLREQLLHWLRQACAEQVSHLGNAEVERRLAHALRVAAEHGYRDADDVAASFVTLMFQLGPAFHRHPAMRRVLDDPATAPRLRLARLPAQVSAWSWAAATDAGDAAWHTAMSLETA
jgi:hypothetical protein